MFELSSGGSHTVDRVPADRPADHAPRALLLVMFLAWYSHGSVLILIGLDSYRLSGWAQGFIGSDVAVTGVGTNASVLPALAGFGVLLLATLLALGQGWVLRPLVALAAVVVVILALKGTWLALIAMGTMVVAALVCCVPSVHDHLYADTSGNGR